MAEGCLTPGRPNVLLVAFNQSSFEELAIVAQAIRTDGRFNPVLAGPAAKVSPNHNAPELNGIDLYWLEEPPNGQSEPAGETEAGPGLLGRLWRNLAGRIGRIFSRTVIGQVTRNIRFLKARKEQAGRILDSFRPAAMLLADERYYKIGPPFIKAARERGCPVLAVPTAVLGESWVNRLAEPVFKLGRRPRRWLKGWEAKRWPDQVFHSTGGPVFFYRPELTIALAWLGMLPPRPWAGGGQCDLFGARGAEEQADLIGRGLPADKVVVIGQPSYDNLFRAAGEAGRLRADLDAKYSLDPARKLIVCSIPHMAEHGLLGWPEHWEHARFLVKSLTDTGANVLLSLHPVCDLEQYRFLEDEYPARLAEERLGRMLPAADIFVASYSSTVLWAVLLGLPAVVVDFFQAKYGFFDNLDGVVVVTEREALSGVLSRVVKDQGYYDRLQSEQKRAAVNIAPFDGRASQRIIDLIADRQGAAL